MEDVLGLSEVFTPVLSLQEPCRDRLHGLGSCVCPLSYPVQADLHPVTVGPVGQEARDWDKHTVRSFNTILEDCPALKDHTQMLQGLSESVASLLPTSRPALSSPSRPHKWLSVVDFNNDEGDGQSLFLCFPDGDPSLSSVPGPSSCLVTMPTVPDDLAPVGVESASG